MSQNTGRLAVGLLTIMMLGLSGAVVSAVAQEPQPFKQAPSFRPTVPKPQDRANARQEPAVVRTGQVSAADFGTRGDGVVDDTAALQRALDAAQEKGPICFVPPGKYRLNGSLVVPAGVTLKGASGGVPHSEHPIGTVLLAYGGRGQTDGTPLVTLKPNATIRNLIIHYRLAVHHQLLCNLSPDWFSL